MQAQMISCMSKCIFQKPHVELKAFSPDIRQEG
jgi:hypothetical protein